MIVKPEGWTDEHEDKFNRTLFDIFEFGDEVTDEEKEFVNKSRRHAFLWFLKTWEKE